MTSRYKDLVGFRSELQPRPRQAQVLPLDPKPPGMVAVSWPQAEVAEIKFPRNGRTLSEVPADNTHQAGVATSGWEAAGYRPRTRGTCVLSNELGF